jgi:MFS family permease
MIQSFEVAEYDIAFYSGVLIAVFAFGGFLTSVVWAWVSDKAGRKSTLLVGIFYGLVTTLTLGLSPSAAVAIASRAFGGLFNPNVGLVQTCTRELARKEHDPVCWPLRALMHIRPSQSNSAMTFRSLVGPVLGGLLADPAALYPFIFPQESLWTSYPYLLPNLAVGLLQVLTLILAFLVLQETHPGMPGHPATEHSVL